MHNQHAQFVVSVGCGTGRVRVGLGSGLSRHVTGKNQRFSESFGASNEGTKLKKSKRNLAKNVE